LLLVTLFLLASCTPTLPTLTGGTSTIGTERAIATDVCRAWKAVSYSSRDTSETQLQVRANNEARSSYCRHVSGN
jgi:hypothetical protein